MDAPNPLIQLIQMHRINLWTQYKVLQSGSGSHSPKSSSGFYSPKPSLGFTNKIQAQVPAGQIPAQGPAGQIPAQGPAQIGQNEPMQPPPQPAPVQLVPGRYCSAHSPDNLSKLDRKDTWILSKPEEDAESHLLSTRGLDGNT